MSYLWLPNQNVDMVGVYKPVYDKSLNNWRYEYISDKFETPDIIFGKLPVYAKHIWNTFVTKDRTLGVLLTGDKGSGKTELGKLLANKAIENGMSVIMLSGLRPTNELLSQLEQLKNVVIFMDEFGKVFNHNIQDKMLTLLSDPYNTKKLFILTENETYMVNNFILDRPGRVWYHIEFERLPDEVIKEYCEYMKLPKNKINEIRKRASKSNMFSFDQLRAVVEEWLTYPDMTLDEILELLNVKNLRIDKLVVLTEIVTTDGKMIAYKATSVNYKDFKRLSNAIFTQILGIYDNDKVVPDKNLPPILRIGYEDVDEFNDSYFKVNLTLGSYEVSVRLDILEKEEAEVILNGLREKYEIQENNTPQQQNTVPPVTENNYLNI